MDVPCTARRFHAEFMRVARAASVWSRCSPESAVIVLSREFLAQRLPTWMVDPREYDYSYYDRNLTNRQSYF